MDVFGDKEDLFWRVKSFEELNDVWVLDPLQNLNLPHDAFLSLLIDQLKLLINLDCHSAIR